MSKLETINKLAMEIVNDEDEWYQASAINAQRIGLLSQPIMLNENQQIVLEWLINHSQTRNPFATIKVLFCRADFYSTLLSKKVKIAYDSLNKNQEFQVLQAFAEWGLSHERN